MFSGVSMLEAQEGCLWKAMRCGRSVKEPEWWKQSVARDQPWIHQPQTAVEFGGCQVYYHYLGGTPLMNRGLFRVGITSNYIKLQETHDFRRRMVKEVGFNKTSGSLPFFLFLHNLDPCNECRRDMFLWIMFAMVKNCLTYSHSGGWSSIHIYPLLGGGIDIHPLWGLLLCDGMNDHTVFFLK